MADIPYTKNEGSSIMADNYAFILFQAADKLLFENKVYGLSLCERLIRQFKEYGFSKIFLVTDDPDEFDRAPKPNNTTVILLNQIKRNLSAASKAVLIDGNVVVDDRLIKFAVKKEENTRICTDNNPELLFAILQAQTIEMLTKILPDNLNDGNLKNTLFTFFEENKFPVKYPHDFDTYIEDLRLDCVPYLITVDEKTDLKKTENIMYEANFKGTLDFIAIYIYKYPVREITRFISRYPWITPNFITVLSILSSFAVPAFYSVGYFGWAILIGWLMFIFDSVDGKLARLTIRLSQTAGIIEHATSAPAIFLWFASLGWFFSEGKILDPAIPSNWACWTLLILYWVDKSINGLYRTKFKKEIYNHAPVDQKFHLIACRRAIIHLIITIGYLINKPLEAFYFMAFWMVFSFMFHLSRFIWIAYIKRQ